MASETENSAANAASELEAKIVRQVEYYFGDFNLPRDRFLREQIKLDDGWIKLETLLTFNRLKALTTEPSVVVEALKKSSNKLLEISEDESKVRRSVDRPLPESNQENQQKLDEVTVYVKGFPNTTTIDDLLEFFGKYGNCINVFMRKLPSTRTFKGSVFATFSTKEEAEKFLALESVTFNEIELVRCMKKEHSAEKHRQRQERQAEKAKKRAKDGSAKKEESEEHENKLEPENIILGCILKLEGLAENTSWQDVKTFFAPYAEIAFVDCTVGEKEGAVRFADEGSASAVVEKLRSADKKIIIKDAEITATVLEGDEEIEYWKKTAAARKDKREKAKYNRGGGRGKSRGRGGRHGGGRNARENRRDNAEKGKANGKRDADAEMKEHPEKPVEGDKAPKVEKPAEKSDASETTTQTASKREADGLPGSPPEKRVKVDGE
ncbi:la protein homolog [Ornithodoros turicata]|uniref:la protein homolog n=1 Tax=Ornithodoros turicata TaxID=34597 RepID=UPI00313897FF